METSMHARRSTAVLGGGLALGLFLAAIPGAPAQATPRTELVKSTV